MKKSIQGTSVRHIKDGRVLYYVSFEREVKDITQPWDDPIIISYHISNEYYNVEERDDIKGRIKDLFKSNVVTRSNSDTVYITGDISSNIDTLKENGLITKEQSASLQDNLKKVLKYDQARKGEHQNGGRPI